MQRAHLIITNCELCGEKLKDTVFLDAELRNKGAVVCPSCMERAKQRAEWRRRVREYERMRRLLEKPGNV
jgi:ribosome-binding protein aMBF1 (putative translation factor)